MNKIIFIGTIWICISVYNYWRYIPEDQKKNTSFVAFVGFATISPLVTVIVYGVHYINKLLNL
jgi:hypothetical protein